VGRGRAGRDRSGRRFAARPVARPGGRFAAPGLAAEGLALTVARPPGPQPQRVADFAARGLAAARRAPAPLGLAGQPGRVPAPRAAGRRGGGANDAASERDVGFRRRFSPQPQPQPPPLSARDAKSVQCM